jgi:hypothetical protein
MFSGRRVVRVAADVLRTRAASAPASRVQLWELPRQIGDGVLATSPTPIQLMQLSRSGLA